MRNCNSHSINRHSRRSRARANQIRARVSRGRIRGLRVMKDQLPSATHCTAIVEIVRKLRANFTQGRNAAFRLQARRNFTAPQPYASPARFAASCSLKAAFLSAAASPRCGTVRGRFPRTGNSMRVFILNSPWSSWPAYLLAPAQRPAWLRACLPKPWRRRVDRLLGERGHS